jgi:hypothetical protein
MPAAQTRSFPTDAVLVLVGTYVRSEKSHTGEEKEQPPSRPTRSPFRRLDAMKNRAEMVKSIHPQNSIRLTFCGLFLDIYTFWPPLCFATR